MTSIVVVGEDELCCTLGERLVSFCLPNWSRPLPSINTKGITKLRASLPRYQALVHLYPVLCIADTDHVCPLELRQQWIGIWAHGHFLLRFAVSEAESWLLADRAGFAGAFGVSAAVVPRNPEELPDAKRAVIDLARRSNKRIIREEVPSFLDASKPGSGYNLHLCGFVREAWSVAAAVENSNSLNRAVAAIARLRGVV